MRKNESKPITFGTLDVNAPIFNELQSEKYIWWDCIVKNPNLYVEIRKNNEVHVYYEGGRVIRLHYCTKHKKIQAFTHHKYLSTSEKSTGYVECADRLNTDLESIVKNVQIYSRKHGISDKENWSEAYIKGNIRIKHPLQYLDSEFAYNSGQIRIDLIECNDGGTRFVELKRIDDARMLTNDRNPKILDQVEKYRLFIEENQGNLLEYYQRIYDLKKKLKLPVPSIPPTTVNTEPLLLIFDRWTKNTPNRTKHTAEMKRILDTKGINYLITKDF